VLDDVADPFIDSRSQCVAAVHRMTTTADFVPRQRRPYRVLYTVKHEAGRPSQELRDRDLSRPSDNLMVNPIACVANEDGGGRIACDYRDRNLMYSLFVILCNCIYSVYSELCYMKTGYFIIVQYRCYYVYVLFDWICYSERYCV